MSGGNGDGRGWGKENEREKFLCGRHPLGNAVYFMLEIIAKI